MLLKLRKIRKSVLLFGKAIMVALIVVAFAIVWRIEYPDTSFYPEAAFWQKGNLFMVLLYAVIFVFFLRVYNATKFGVFRLMEIIYSLFLAIVFTNIITYAQLCLMGRQLLSFVPMLKLISIELSIAVLSAYVLNKVYFMLYPARELLVIRPVDESAGILVKKLHMRRERYKVRAVISEELDFLKICEFIDKSPSVVVGSIDIALRDRIINYCNLKKKRIYIIPSTADIMIKSSHETQLFDTPMFYCKNSGISTEGTIVKRFVDLLVSVIAIIITSPIMLITAICIKLEDGGAVLFSQERLTKNGKIFRVHKFRSMIEDAEKKGAQLAEKNDGRITKVGGVIRRTRIDELPQLINILMGDMSLVGPRPERPEIAAEYEKAFPEFVLRLGTKAGLTGYAQIFGKYNTRPEDKLLLDLMYIEDWSLLLDLRLLMLTVKIIFMPDSTEGFEEGEGLVLPAEEHLDLDDEEK